MKRDAPQGVGKAPYPLPLRPPVAGLVPFLSGQLVGGLAEPFHGFQFLPHGLHVDAVRLLLGGQQVDLAPPFLRRKFLAAGFQFFQIPSRRVIEDQFPAVALLEQFPLLRLYPGKLIGLGRTIGPAFADFAPGLHPFDWLVGIAGAVILRLVVYAKAKKVSKYRRDEEYGSARWGRESDIKPFVDPKFENNIILTKTEFLTMNTRPKNPANARNLNACVIGSSGSGKTRFWLTPQLLQAHSSYVVVDPKGGTLSQVGYFLQRKKGYKVKVFNSIDFSKSMHYNPLAYVRNEADILKFVDTLISNTKGEGKESDPFWTKAETLLYCALIVYIIFEGPPEDRNINTLVDMIGGMEVKENDEDYMNAVDYMFAGLEKRKPDCFAVKQYKKYKLASGDVCSK